MLKALRNDLYSKIKRYIDDVYNYFFVDECYEKIENDLILLLNDFNVDNIDDIISLYKEDIKKIKEILLTDIEAIYLYDPACWNNLEIILAYPGFYATFIYRLANQLAKYKIKILPRMMSEYCHSLTGIDIHPNAKIGDHFVIDHGTGIVIGETAIIGNYVKIFHGVTLGAASLKAGNSLKGTKRHPTIEDNVTIYANAMLLGNIRISKGTTIGCGSIINKDI